VSEQRETDIIYGGQIMHIHEKFVESKALSILNNVFVNQQQSRIFDPLCETLQVTHGCPREDPTYIFGDWAGRATKNR